MSVKCIGCAIGLDAGPRAYPAYSGNGLLTLMSGEQLTLGQRSGPDFCRFSFLRKNSNVPSCTLSSFPSDLIPHYTLHDRLSISQVSKPVLYSTYMSRTGWGQRPLSPDELASCFDLPDLVAWEARFPSDIVPLQLHRAVIDFVLDGFGKEIARPTKSRKLIDDSTIDSPVNGIWLAPLNAWLLGSWVEVAIADKAVKSNDAEVDTRPWRKRISLVLPCRLYTLATIERFAMRCWRRSVITSFFSYLRHEYGPDWWSNLAPIGSTLGAARVLERSSLVMVSLSPLPTPEWGGVLSVSGNLAVDLSKGLAVIGHILQSTWVGMD